MGGYLDVEKSPDTKTQLIVISVFYSPGMSNNPGAKKKI